MTNTLNDDSLNDKLKEVKEVSETREQAQEALNTLREFKVKFNQVGMYTDFYEPSDNDLDRGFGGRLWVCVDTNENRDKQYHCYQFVDGKPLVYESYHLSGSGTQLNDKLSNETLQTSIQTAGKNNMLFVIDEQGLVKDDSLIKWRGFE